MSKNSPDEIEMVPFINGGIPNTEFSIIMSGIGKPRTRYKLSDTQIAHDGQIYEPAYYKCINCKNTFDYYVDIRASTKKQLCKCGNLACRTYGQYKVTDRPKGHHYQGLIGYCIDFDNDGTYTYKTLLFDENISWGNKCQFRDEFLTKVNE